MEAAIIVAGGSGKRMRSEIPKQFLAVAGRPVLNHTIEAFYRYSKKLRIILVLPRDQISFWKQQVSQTNLSIPHEITEGGETRTESVRNGLKMIGDEDVVAIHDGVRPLVSKQTISAAFSKASESGNAITSVPLKDSIRKIDKDGGSQTVSRSEYRLIQTPQVFKGSVIKEAYKKIASSAKDFTDDASVLEYSGHKIHLVDGDYTNIKITTPDDLLVAECFLKSS